MARLFEYKYICDECGEATCFTRQERTQAAGMQCRFCGCRRLEPSKASHAKHNMPIFHELKREYDEKVEEKQKGI